MRAPWRLQTCLLFLAMAPGLVPPAAYALLNVDGTRNQVFIFGHVSFGYDSNVFSDASERDDTFFSMRLGGELQRRRGLIGVNAGVTLDYVRFREFSQESGLNPDFTLELDKSTGRTTGKVKLRAYRTNQADSAVNLRTTSWNAPLTLDLRYPVNEKLYLASSTGYLRRDYTENAALVDYTDFTQGVDVFYVYNSRLDLVTGYRLRTADTSIHEAQDHSVTLGATGALLPKVTGTLRLGYQSRRLTGPARTEHDQFTVSSALTWVPTRKLTVELSVTRDFNLTALGDSVDSFGTSLTALYSFNRRLEFEGGGSYGRNRFLALGPGQRTDDFFDWTAAARYTFNEHLTIGGTFSRLINWSTLDFSDFHRTQYSLELSSRF